MLWKERRKFVLKWEERFSESEGRVNIAELCRMFGISRQTGYDWLRKYREEGKLNALLDRSRRPHHSPTKVTQEVEDLLVSARKQRPTWGSRKLLTVLTNNYPSISWPSASCVTTILIRNGLVTKRRKRRKSPVVCRIPFASCDRPNAVWCIDFKGKFRTRDGVWCHVFTVEDAYSRFLIRAEALLDPTAAEIERVLDSAFQEFGLPDAIRSDNGPPFASTGAGGLTTLSVWWLKLGFGSRESSPANHNKMAGSNVSIEPSKRSSELRPRTFKRKVERSTSGARITTRFGRTKLSECAYPQMPTSVLVAAIPRSSSICQHRGDEAGARRSGSNRSTSASRFAATARHRRKTARPSDR